MPGVYILNDPATQYLKIGRATRIEDRFANLRTANPRLVLLEWVETPYDSALESYIHNRLASFRREGEFFEVDIDTVKREITAAISLLSERPTNEALSEVISIQDVTPSRDPMDEEVYLLSKILNIRSELEKLRLEESVLLDRLKVSVGLSAGLNNWVTFNPVERRSIDMTALERDFPEMLEKYRIKSVSRTLRIQPFIRQREVLA